MCVAARQMLASRLLLCQISGSRHDAHCLARVWALHQIWCVRRYAVRDSWDNLQLKQGVVAAFAVAKTSAAATAVLEQSTQLALKDPALWSLVAEHLLKDTISFAAALVALQLAVQRQIVTPSSGPP